MGGVSGAGCFFVFVSLNVLCKFPVVTIKIQLLPTALTGNCIHEHVRVGVLLEVFFAPFFFFVSLKVLRKFRCYSKNPACTYMYEMLKLARRSSTEILWKLENVLLKGNSSSLEESVCKTQVDL